MTHCVQARRMLWKFMLAAALLAGALSASADAEILSSTVYLDVHSQIHRWDGARFVVASEMKDADTATQGSTTNPLSVGVSHTNQFGSGIVDQSASLEATFVGPTRGVVNLSYDKFSAPYIDPVKGAVNSGAIFNQGGPFPGFPALWQMNFIAESDQLQFGLSSNAPPPLSPPDLRLVHPEGSVVNVERRTAGGGWEGVAVEVGTSPKSVALVPGEEYRAFWSMGSGGGVLGEFSMDVRFAWSMAGGSQLDPILPDSATDGFVFNDVVSGAWYDPPVANGYTYETTDGSLFTGILGLPTGFDDPFAVYVEGTLLGLFNPGDTVDFTGFAGGGVSLFSIGGIQPGTDPDDPRAFPIQLAFNQSVVDFRIAANIDDPTAVPEPTSLVMLSSLALTALGVVRLRRRQKRRAAAEWI